MNWVRIGPRSQNYLSNLPQAHSGSSLFFLGHLFRLFWSFGLSHFPQIRVILGFVDCGGGPLLVYNFHLRKACKSFKILLVAVIATNAMSEHLPVDPGSAILVCFVSYDSFSLLGSSIFILQILGWLFASIQTI
jgi:hypothetical protein